MKKLKWISSFVTNLAPVLMIPADAALTGRKRQVMKKAPVPFRPDRKKKKGGNVKRIRRAAVVAGMVFSGICYTAPIQAGQDVAEAVISHRHTGDSVRGSGCYRKACYHHHEGSLQLGGGCYGKSVCHEHTGSETTGGGCFGAARLHEHTGDSAAGGGCYQQPVYHTHGSACYRQRTCTVRCVGVGTAYQVSDSWCGCHGDTQLNEADVSWEHSSCGAGRQSRKMQYLSYHGWENQLNEQSHSYQDLDCSAGGQLEEYRLDCGLAQGTVTGYDTNCGKSADDIEYYEQDCGKTEETIEYYMADCGKDENTRVGVLSLRADQTQDWVKEVTLKASYTRESSFEVKEDCFIWNEQAATNKQVLCVKENGVYTVRLNGGEDSDADSVKVTLRIGNIDHTAPVVTAVEGVPEEWTNRAVTIKVQAADLQPAREK